MTKIIRVNSCMDCPLVDYTLYPPFCRELSEGLWYSDRYDAVRSPEGMREDCPLETEEKESPHLEIGSGSTDRLEEWKEKTKDNEWWLTHDEFMKKKEKVRS